MYLYCNTMMAGIKDIPVFFIVGRERSGTTLLQVLLDNHPNIVIPTESPFIRHLYRKYAHRARWSKNNVLEFFHDLLEEPYMQLWHVDKEKLEHDLLSVTDPCFASLCKTVYFHSISARGKNNPLLIGDKNPQYSLFIPQLLKVFPSAKFLFIIRDPRDQVMSMMKVNFEKKLVSSLAYRWKYFNRSIGKQREMYPQQFCLVKYEELVQQPELQLRNICDFLNVPFNVEMINSHSRAAFYVSSRSLLQEHHQTLLKPIDAGMAYQWKQKMREKDVRMTDTVAGGFSEQLGYERQYAASWRSMLKALPGMAYGRLYFTFLNMLYSLPYSVRMMIFRKFISKSFKFWKESEQQE